MAQHLSRLSWAALAFATLMVLAGSGRGLYAAPAPPPKSQPQPLPQKVVDDWQKAGALVGWVGRNHHGFVEFRARPEDLIDVVPGFRFLEWRPGLAEKLSIPEAPFGLYLWEAKVRSTELKHFARFKSLHTLYLGSNQLMDADLKELAELRTLHTLDLGNNDVTAAGLKDLAGFTSLPR